MKNQYNRMENVGENFVVTFLNVLIALRHSCPQTTTTTHATSTQTLAVFKGI